MLSMSHVDMHPDCASKALIMSICGNVGRAQWAPDDRQLASGGNDNAVAVWAAGGGAEAGPVFRDTSHCAAVKALAWSPHQHGLLATGGGTTDRHIRRAVQLAEHTRHSSLVSKFCRKECFICISQNCFSLTSPIFLLPSPEQTSAWAQHHHLVQRQSTPLIPLRVLLLKATWEGDRVWNTNTGTAVNAVDTRSQVCALAWSRNVNELVACYGVPCSGAFTWSSREACQRACCFVACARWR